MRDHRSLSLVVILTLFVAAGAAFAGVPTYSTFELQARAVFGGGYNLPNGSSVNSVSPVLNDASQVAFKVVVVGNTGSAGVWTGGAGAGEVVYDAPAERVLGDVAINSLGEVVVHQSLDFVSEGVWRYDPITEMTTLAVPPGGALGIQYFSDPKITTSGVIGGRVDLPAAQAYLSDDGGVQTPYVVEGTDGIAFLFVAEMNDAEQLAGKVRLGGLGNEQPDEIRRWEPDGTFTVMARDVDADAGSPFLGFGNGIGLAENGLVAFNATIAGGDGVFLSDGTTTTTIATSADPEIDSIDFFWPAVNADGLVVFRAFEPGGTRAIFAGDGSTLRRVVGEHDVLPTDLGDARIDRPDASPVFAGNPDVNAHGDVVFNASLTAPDNPNASYGSGIFVAYAGSSVSVPADADAAALKPMNAMPNPFRVGTTLSFTVVEPGEVSVAILDVSGRLVRRLDVGPLAAGRYERHWDGRDARGEPVAGGVYHARIDGPAGNVLRLIRLR